MRVRICSLLLGVWLVFAPALLRYDDGALTVERIAGPVVVFFAMLSLRDAMRSFRVLNVLCGAWLLLAPWLLRYHSWVPWLNEELAGAALIALVALGGTARKQTGGGWRALWPPRHIRTEQQADGATYL